MHERKGQLTRRCVLTRPRCRLTSIATLRVSMGAIYLWFGLLKFFPRMSPADDLATKTMSAITFNLVRPSVSLPLLALMESLIGAGLILGVHVRAVLALVAVHLSGTFLPLVILPHRTWLVFPLAPTLEGQYILKNLILISGALVIATATVHRHDPPGSGPTQRPPGPGGTG